MTSRKQEGFIVAKKTAMVDFSEDSEWHGVEAKVIISVPFETLFWFQRNASSTEADASNEALQRFGDDFLLEWNVCDSDGNPYPATAEGVVNVADSALVTNLMMGWIEAVVKPPENLSKPSDLTGMSEELLTQELATASAPLRS